MILLSEPLRQYSYQRIRGEVPVPYKELDVFPPLRSLPIIAEEETESAKGS
jgi:hypothetical protein